MHPKTQKVFRLLRKYKRGIHIDMKEFGKGERIGARVYELRHDFGCEIETIEYQEGPCRYVLLSFPNSIA